MFSMVTLDMFIMHGIIIRYQAIRKVAQQVAKAVSKLYFPAIKMNNMLKSFENIFHSQHGETLHVYNAFIRYQAIRKRE